MLIHTPQKIICQGLTGEESIPSDPNPNILISWLANIPIRLGNNSHIDVSFVLRCSRRWMDQGNVGPGSSGLVGEEPCKGATGISNVGYEGGVGNTREVGRDRYSKSWCS